MPRLDGHFGYVGVTFEDGSREIFHADCLGFFVFDGQVLLWHGPSEKRTLLDIGDRRAIHADDYSGASITWGAL